jgi:phenol 2-monooxygenase
LNNISEIVFGLIRDRQLASSLASISHRFTPSAADIDSVIEPILVLSSKFLDTEQERIPNYFWPASGKWKIRGAFPALLNALNIVTLMNLDLHKTYIDDEHYNAGHGHAYEKYGVDVDVGALVIVRPDQCKNTDATVRCLLMCVRCFENHDYG